jgi:hypothetical protein
MLEGIGHVRRRALAEDQLGVGQLVERRTELVRVQLRHRAEQLEREPPPDRRRSLRDLPHRRQTIEARHQRILHRGRDRQGRDRSGELVAVAGETQEAGFEDRLGQLFDEQRHAVGLLEDLVEDLPGQQLVAADPFDQSRALAPVEPVEPQLGDVLPPDPRRGELGPKAQEHHRRQRPHPLDQQIEQLERRGIGPMQVFVELEHGAGAGQIFQLIEQNLQRALSVTLRRQVQWRKAPPGGYCQQISDQRHGFVRSLGHLAKQVLELGQSRLRAVLGDQACRPLQVRDHGMESTVGMMRRAEMAEDEVRLACEPFPQRTQQPGFADAGLARKQDHLAIALPGRCPALHQHRELMRAPDQRRDLATTQRLETALGPALALDSEDPDRLGESLQRLWSKVGEIEEAADQRLRVRPDHHRARLRHGLKPRCHVRGYAEHLLLLGGALADELADHHVPGRDPDPRGECDAVIDGDPADRPGQLQTRTHGTLGIVLVRPRIAEIGEHAVTQVPGDVPVPAPDHRNAAVPIGTHQSADVLRIEPARQRGRADEIAEHHGELPAFGDMHPGRGEV